MANRLQYINCLRTQPNIAIVNACQAKDNILHQTAKGNSPFKLNSGESKGIYTLGKSEKDKDIPAKDLADDQISVLTKTFNIITTCPYSPSKN